jgi:hypothetical protein
MYTIEGNCSDAPTRPRKPTNMPTKEYRILIDGKIVNREYTIREHEIMVKVFEEHGKPFTTEIVDLV